MREKLSIPRHDQFADVIDHRGPLVGNITFHPWIIPAASVIQFDDRKGMIVQLDEEVIRPFFSLLGKGLDVGNLLLTLEFERYGKTSGEWHKPKILKYLAK